LCVAGAAYGQIQEKSDGEKQEDDAFLCRDETVILHVLANSSIGNEVLSALFIHRKHCMEQSAGEIEHLPLWSSWSILFIRSPSPRHWERFQAVE
jgi:hypothetical protein